MHLNTGRSDHQLVLPHFTYNVDLPYVYMIFIIDVHVCVYLTFQLPHLKFTNTKHDMESAVDFVHYVHYIQHI